MAHSDVDVFRWSFDSDNYKSPYSDEVYNQLDEHAHLASLGKWWGKSRSMKLSGPKRAGIPDLARHNQELPILNDRSLAALQDLIPKSAQRLKISCGEYDYWALNILWTKNALVRDESKCRISVDGDVTEVVEGVFLRDVIKGDVFTVPRCLEIYVTGKFLNAVEEYGLKGLVTDLEPMGRLV